MFEGGDKEERRGNNIWVGVGRREGFVLGMGGGIGEDGG